eukprot:2905628-Rhodomonas_salina.2
MISVPDRVRGSLEGATGGRKGSHYPMITGTDSGRDVQPGDSLTLCSCTELSLCRRLRFKMCCQCAPARRDRRTVTVCRLPDDSDSCEDERAGAPVQPRFNRS